MQFISMDLIGEFHLLSQQGHRYALTVICMHTSYIFCIPLKTKTAEEVVQAYLHHVYSLEVVRKSCLIMALNSRTNCLKKLQTN